MKNELNSFITRNINKHNHKKFRTLKLIEPRAPRETEDNSFDVKSSFTTTEFKNFSEYQFYGPANNNNNVHH